MLIECRQRRDARSKRVGRKDTDAGSKSKLFGTAYWFRPQPDLTMDGGDPLAHVCVVEDPRAIQRYLSIPEAYNEFGKPPKLAQATTDLPAGQPPVVVELLDDDDTLGASDSPPYVSDPLSKARVLEKEWVESMLAKPVNAIVKAMPGLDGSELALLYAGESNGKKRSELLEILHETGDIAELQME